MSRRSLLPVAVSTALLLGACDSDASPASPAPTTLPAPVTGPPSAATDGDGGTVEGSTGAACDGLSAEMIGAVAGVPFDTADDTSVSGDVSCTFTMRGATYGVTVSRESTTTYLAGDVDGVPLDEALITLADVASFALDEEPTVATVVVSTGDAVSVAGIHVATSGPAGFAGTVVDGEVVLVHADGAALGGDPAALATLAVAVLDLAVRAR